MPWLMQQDTALGEEHNNACLLTASRLAHPDIDIPIYFFGDNVNYNESYGSCATEAAEPEPFHSSYSVIEIVPDSKYEDVDHI